MTIHAPKGRGKAKEVESRSAASETYALPISTPTYMKAAFANLSDAASLFSGATSDDNLTENIKALKASARSLSEAADELALGVAPAAHHQPLPIRIITHNVRYATESPFEGEERWSVRFPRLCAQLAFNSSNPGSFICLQEVLHSQLVEILKELNDPENTGDRWSYIGVGRDDGKQDGEYSPVLYRPAVWRLVSWNTTWLSQTPNRPSLGWDAACNRLVTSGIFEHRASTSKIAVLSTHFDHQGVEARQKSASLILQTISSLRFRNKLAAVFLAGDFNSPPDDGAYLTMTGPQSGMEDIRLQVPERHRMGNELTYTSFGYVDNKQTRIDFIFAAKEDKVKYGTYAVLGNRYDDGVYLSDHRTCVADVEVSSRCVDQGSRVI